MAEVTLRIKDTDLQQVAVDVHLNPQFPESALMYTTAQMLAKELITVLQNLAAQVNSRMNQQSVIDATNLD